MQDEPEGDLQYDAALAFGYSEFWVLYNRGGAYAELHQFDKARKDLQHARQLQPHHPDLQKLIDRLPR